MIPVVEILESVVGAVSKDVLPVLQRQEPGITGVRYDYGHWVEISSKLQDMTQHQTERFNKFPLIMVMEDIPVRTVGEYPQVTLQVYILHWTNNTYNSQQRQQKVFSPILSPIYDSFIKHLDKSHHIVSTATGKFPHTRIDRKFYGRESVYGNTGNVPNEFVDAIEMRGLELNLFDNNC